MCIKQYKCENKKYRVVPATSRNKHKADGPWRGILWCACMRVYRVRVCACVCTCVCRGKKYIGTMHQLSTCNQRFGGLVPIATRCWDYPVFLIFTFILLYTHTYSRGTKIPLCHRFVWFMASLVDVWIWFLWHSNLIPTLASYTPYPCNSFSSIYYGTTAS